MSIPLQLQLNFQSPQLSIGKRTERLTVTCSAELKNIVETICRMTGETVSEAGHRYFLAGLKDDIGRIFMAEPHLDKTLSNLIAKKN